MAFMKVSAKDVAYLPGSMILGSARTVLESWSRDLIRQRIWDYSALAFGCPESKREDLRKEIIASYGEKLELIAPRKEPQKKHKKKRKGKRKKSDRNR